MYSYRLYYGHIVADLQPKIDEPWRLALTLRLHLPICAPVTISG